MRRTQSVIRSEAILCGGVLQATSMTRVSRALDTPRAVLWLFELLRGSGAPASLGELGMPAEMLPGRPPGSMTS